MSEVTHISEGRVHAGLTSDGHLILAFAERGLDGGMRFVDRGMTLVLNAETLFVVNELAWERAEDGDTILAWIPSALGVDQQLRAPKRLFRAIQVKEKGH